MYQRLFLILLLAAWSVATAPGQLRHGMVASVHPKATEAGLRVLQGGGNAIDATVAVALMLGVVDGDNSGIGGGCLMLIGRADGSIIAIDGRETAPGAATPDMFARPGRTDLSRTGALASGVPGALAAYEFAVQHYGRKKLADLLEPAAELAAKGFIIDSAYARTLHLAAANLARFSSTRAVFFNGATPWKEGDRLRQPDLAVTYKKIAEQGSAWFYRGPYAQAVEKWMQANGGILTADDFRRYEIKLRDPIISTYRQYKIAGFPPPSSGGVAVAEMLNILERFDLKSLDEPTRYHVLAEAMKLAFADRAHWLGDADFVPVPRGLFAKPYGAALAARINRDSATTVAAHGVPPDWEQDVFKKHTTHFSVADEEGNWVACTATINTSFGSKVIIPGTGVMLNNEMDDFSSQPGTPNYYGLLGGAANAIAPGKRPLSSMSPTLVFKDGKPILAMGAAGGPKIITQVVQELVSMLDLGLSPLQTLQQPRIHHQWSPDQLLIEKKLSPELKAALARRGHKLQESSGQGVSQIVARNADDSGFTGAADPRAGGTAEGW